MDVPLHCRLRRGGSGGGVGVERGQRAEEERRNIFGGRELVVGGDRKTKRQNLPRTLSSFSRSLVLSTHRSEEKRSEENLIRSGEPIVHQTQDDNLFNPFTLHTYRRERSLSVLPTDGRTDLTWFPRGNMRDYILDLLFVVVFCPYTLIEFCQFWSRANIPFCKVQYFLVCIQSCVYIYIYMGVGCTCVYVYI